MKIIPVGIIMVGAYFFSYTILIKRKKRKNDEVLFLNKEMKQGKMIEIVCPMDGELLELEDVPDKDFSDKINGDGFAILPDNGDIFSPIDGVVSKINEKKKTIKIFHSNEVELLINFGVESSFINHMECEFFVHEGDKVKVRDLLMRVDIGDINKDAASIITPVVFTSLPENMEIVVHPGKKIKMGERNIIVIEEKKQ